MIERYQVNQPSSHMQYHSLHGATVLADLSKQNNGICTCWFTSGNVISQRIHANVLNKGWESYDTSWINSVRYRRIT